MLTFTPRVSVISCIAIVAFVTACRDHATATSPSARTPSLTRIEGDDARIRHLGRGIREDGDLKFAWPASGFTFRFRGARARMQISDEALLDSTPGNDILEIQVDDLPPYVWHLRLGGQDVSIGQRLREGEHTVSVRKRTEAEVGTVSLQMIELDSNAELLSAPPPRPLLEAIGDSITAGFGCEGLDASCAFSPATENALASYTALAARSLNLDYSAVAWSGKGIVRNNDPRDRDVLPEIYDRALPAVPSSRWVHADQRAAYIVVNLGTNDCTDTCPPEQALCDGYDALLARVRSNHPEAYIVMILGPMLYNAGAIQHRSVIQSALERSIRTREAQGDARIGLLQLWADPNEGVGCQSHPNRRAHARFANELVAFIREHDTVAH